MTFEPESAVSINLGAIYQTDSFYGLTTGPISDPIQLENVGQIVSAYSTNGCANDGNGAGTATCDVLRGRLSPNGSGR
ncbi:MAG: hypothetical protein ACNYPE_08680 [Candidatus Azotimanducaceae bacterium WSBS_2022_MAG_OTU7]